jgi:hypothetical protein
MNWKCNKCPSKCILLGQAAVDEIKPLVCPWDSTLVKWKKTKKGGK